MERKGKDGQTPPTDPKIPLNTAEKYLKINQHIKKKYASWAEGINARNLQADGTYSLQFSMLAVEKVLHLYFISIISHNFQKIHYKVQIYILL